MPSRGQNTQCLLIFFLPLSLTFWVATHERKRVGIDIYLYFHTGWKQGTCTCKNICRQHRQKAGSAAGLPLHLQEGISIMARQCPFPCILTHSSKDTTQSRCWTVCKEWLKSLKKTYKATTLNCHKWATNSMGHNALWPRMYSTTHVLDLNILAF